MVVLTRPRTLGAMSTSPPNALPRCSLARGSVPIPREPVYPCRIPVALQCQVASTSVLAPMKAAYFDELMRSALQPQSQLRAGEQIEEIDRTGSVDPSLDAISTLVSAETDITIAQGYRLRDWRGGCVTTTSYQSRSAFPLLFQSLGPPNQSRWGLSRCHWP